MVHSPSKCLALATVALALATLTAAAQAQTPAQGETINGISCDQQEGQRIHIHQHLVIFDHGTQVPIPANVGQPALKRCIYWIHTHTPDGIIHLEAPIEHSFTLADFFHVWGQPLSRTQAASALAGKNARLKVWVNGKPYTGDPGAIKLESHTDIVIEAGPPFPPPPRFTNWGRL